MVGVDAAFLGSVFCAVLPHPRTVLYSAQNCFTANIETERVLLRLQDIEPNSASSKEQYGLNRNSRFKKSSMKAGQTEGELIDIRLSLGRLRGLGQRIGDLLVQLNEEDEDTEERESVGRLDDKVRTQTGRSHLSDLEDFLGAVGHLSKGYKRYVKMKGEEARAAKLAEHSKAVVSDEKGNPQPSPPIPQQRRKMAVTTVQTAGYINTVPARQIPGAKKVSMTSDERDDRGLQEFVEYLLMQSPEFTATEAKLKQNPAFVHLRDETLLLLKIDIILACNLSAVLHLSAVSLSQHWDLTEVFSLILALRAHLATVDGSDLAEQFFTCEHTLVRTGNASAASSSSLRKDHESFSGQIRRFAVRGPTSQRANILWLREVLHRSEDFFGNRLWDRLGTLDRDKYPTRALLGMWIKTLYQTALCAQEHFASNPQNVDLPSATGDINHQPDKSGSYKKHHPLVQVFNHVFAPTYFEMTDILDSRHLYHAAHEVLHTFLAPVVVLQYAEGSPASVTSDEEIYRSNNSQKSRRAQKFSPVNSPWQRLRWKLSYDKACLDSLVTQALGTLTFAPFKSKERPPESNALATTSLGITNPIPIISSAIAVYHMGHDLFVELTLQIPCAIQRQSALALDKSEKAFYAGLSKIAVTALKNAGLFYLDSADVTLIGEEEENGERYNRQKTFRTCRFVANVTHDDVVQLLQPNYTEIFEGRVKKLDKKPTESTESKETAIPESSKGLEVGESEAPDVGRVKTAEELEAEEQEAEAKRISSLLDSKSDRNNRNYTASNNPTAEEEARQYYIMLASWLSIDLLRYSSNASSVVNAEEKELNDLVTRGYDSLRSGSTVSPSGIVPKSLVTASIIRSRYLVLSQLGPLNGYSARVEVYEERFAELKILVFYQDTHKDLLRQHQDRNAPSNQAMVWKHRSRIQQITSSADQSNKAVQMKVDRSVVYSLVAFADTVLEVDKLDNFDTAAMAYIFSNRISLRPSLGWMRFLYPEQSFGSNKYCDQLSLPLNRIPEPQIVIRKRGGPGRLVGRRLINLLDRYFEPTQDLTSFGIDSDTLQKVEASVDAEDAGIFTADNHQKLDNGFLVLLTIFEVHSEAPTHELRIVLYHFSSGQTVEYRLSPLERMLLFSGNNDSVYDLLYEVDLEEFAGTSAATKVAQKTDGGTEVTLLDSSMANTIADETGDAGDAVSRRDKTLLNQLLQRLRLCYTPMQMPNAMIPEHKDRILLSLTEAQRRVFNGIETQQKLKLTQQRGQSQTRDPHMLLESRGQWFELKAPKVYACDGDEEYNLQPRCPAQAAFLEKLGAERRAFAQRGQDQSEDEESQVEEVDNDEDSLTRQEKARRKVAVDPVWSWSFYLDRSPLSELRGNLLVSATLQSSKRGILITVFDPLSRREVCRFLPFLEILPFLNERISSAAVLEDVLGNMDESVALDLLDDVLKCVEVEDSDIRGLVLRLVSDDDGSSESNSSDDERSSSEESSDKSAAEEGSEEIVKGNVEAVRISEMLTKSGNQNGKAKKPSIPDVVLAYLSSIPRSLVADGGLGSTATQSGSSSVRLVFNILAAQGLNKPKGVFSTRHPLVIVKYNQREIGRTCFVPHTLDPVFPRNATSRFEVYVSKQALLHTSTFDFEVYDTDPRSHPADKHSKPLSQGSVDKKATEDTTKTKKGHKPMHKQVEATARLNSRNVKLGDFLGSVHLQGETLSQLLSPNESESSSYALQPSRRLTSQENAHVRGSLLLTGKKEALLASFASAAPGTHGRASIRGSIAGAGRASSVALHKGGGGMGSISLRRSVQSSHQRANSVIAAALASAVAAVEGTGEGSNTAAVSISPAALSFFVPPVSATPSSQSLTSKYVPRHFLVLHLAFLHLKPHLQFLAPDNTYFVQCRILVDGSEHVASSCVPLIPLGTPHMGNHKLGINASHNFAVSQAMSGLAIHLPAVSSEFSPVIHRQITLLLYIIRAKGQATGVLRELQCTEVLAGRAEFGGHRLFSLLQRQQDQLTKHGTKLLVPSHHLLNSSIILQAPQLPLNHVLRSQYNLDVHNNIGSLDAYVSLGHYPEQSAVGTHRTDSHVQSIPPTIIGSMRKFYFRLQCLRLPDQLFMNFVQRIKQQQEANIVNHQEKAGTNFFGLGRTNTAAAAAAAAAEAERAALENIPHVEMQVIFNCTTVADKYRVTVVSASSPNNQVVRRASNASVLPAVIDDGSHADESSAANNLDNSTAGADLAPRIATIPKRGSGLLRAFSTISSSVRLPNPATASTTLPNDSDTGNKDKGDISIDDPKGFLVLQVPWHLRLQDCILRVSCILSPGESEQVTFDVELTGEDLVMLLVGRTHFAEDDALNVEEEEDMASMQMKQQYWLRRSLAQHVTPDSGEDSENGHVDREIREDDSKTKIHAPTASYVPATRCVRLPNYFTSTVKANFTGNLRENSPLSTTAELLHQEICIDIERRQLLPSSLSLQPSPIYSTTSMIPVQHPEEQYLESLMNSSSSPSTSPSLLPSLQDNMKVWLDYLFSVGNADQREQSVAILRREQALHRILRQMRTPRSCFLLHLLGFTPRLRDDLLLRIHILLNGVHVGFFEHSESVKLQRQRGLLSRISSPASEDNNEVDVPGEGHQSNTVMQASVKRSEEVLLELPVLQTLAQCHVSVYIEQIVMRKKTTADETVIESIPEGENEEDDSEVDHESGDENASPGRRKLPKKPLVPPAEKVSQALTLLLRGSELVSLAQTRLVTTLPLQLLDTSVHHAGNQSNLESKSSGISLLLQLQPYNNLVGSDDDGAVDVDDDASQSQSRLTVDTEIPVEYPETEAAAAKVGTSSVMVALGEVQFSVQGPLSINNSNSGHANNSVSRVLPSEGTNVTGGLKHRLEDLLRYKHKQQLLYYQHFLAAYRGAPGKNEPDDHSSSSTSAGYIGGLFRSMSQHSGQSHSLSLTSSQHQEQDRFRSLLRHAPSLLLDYGLEVALVLRLNGAVVLCRRGKWNPSLSEANSGSGLLGGLSSLFTGNNNSISHTQEDVTQFSGNQQGTIHWLSTSSSMSSVTSARLRLLLATNKNSSSSDGATSVNNNANYLTIQLLCISGQPDADLLPASQVAQTLDSAAQLSPDIPEFPISLTDNHNTDRSSGKKTHVRPKKGYRQRSLLAQYRGDVSSLATHLTSLHQTAPQGLLLAMAELTGESLTSFWQRCARTAIARAQQSGSIDGSMSSMNNGYLPQQLHLLSPSTPMSATSAVASESIGQSAEDTSFVQAILSLLVLPQQAPQPSAATGPLQPQVLKRVVERPPRKLKQLVRTVPVDSDVPLYHHNDSDGDKSEGNSDMEDEDSRRLTRRRSHRLSRQSSSLKSPGGVPSLQKSRSSAKLAILDPNKESSSARHAMNASNPLLQRSQRRLLPALQTQSDAQGSHSSSQRDSDLSPLTPATFGGTGRFSPVPSRSPLPNQQQQEFQDHTQSVETSALVNSRSRSRGQGVNRTPANNFSTGSLKGSSSAVFRQDKVSEKRDEYDDDEDVVVVTVVDDVLTNDQGLGAASDIHQQSSVAASSVENNESVAPEPHTRRHLELPAVSTTVTLSVHNRAEKDQNNDEDDSDAEKEDNNEEENIAVETRIAFRDMVVPLLVDSDSSEDENNGSDSDNNGEDGKLGENGANDWTKKRADQLAHSAQSTKMMRRKTRRQRRRQVVFATRASKLLRTHSLSQLDVVSDVVYLQDAPDPDAEDGGVNGGDTNAQSLPVCVTEVVSRGCGEVVRRFQVEVLTRSGVPLGACFVSDRVEDVISALGLLPPLRSGTVQ